MPGQWHQHNAIGTPYADLMTWTWALMTSVLATVKPSSTLDSSINFFQPQSCSFLQKRCRVSAANGSADGVSVKHQIMHDPPQTSNAGHCQEQEALPQQRRSTQQGDPQNVEEGQTA